MLLEEAEEGHMVVERYAAVDNNNDINNSRRFEKEDPNFDRKLDLITAGATPFLKEHLLTKITRENCLTIINYVLAMQTESKLKPKSQNTIALIQSLT